MHLLRSGAGSSTTARVISEQAVRQRTGQYLAKCVDDGCLTDTTAIRLCNTGVTKTNLTIITLRCLYTRYTGVCVLTVERTDAVDTICVSGTLDTGVLGTNTGTASTVYAGAVFSDTALGAGIVVKTDAIDALVVDTTFNISASAFLTNLTWAACIIIFTEEFAGIVATDIRERTICVIDTDGRIIFEAWSGR